jgi:hypothetical protein
VSINLPESSSNARLDPSCLGIQDNVCWGGSSAYNQRQVRRGSCAERRPDCAMFLTRRSPLEITLLGRLAILACVENMEVRFPLSYHHRRCPYRY